MGWLNSPVAIYCSFILLLFAVFIREIKEVRRGLGSKDFDRNPETARRLDPNCCLAIFYGTEFKLKTLSLVGKLKCSKRNVALQQQFLDMEILRL